MISFVHCGMVEYLYYEYRGNYCKLSADVVIPVSTKQVALSPPPPSPPLLLLPHKVSYISCSLYQSSNMFTSN